MKTTIIHLSDGSRDSRSNRSVTINVTEDGVGTIESNLHDSCWCGLEYCGHEDSPKQLNTAIDGIESFLLALACAGVEVHSPAFTDALTTALDAISQKFDS